MSEYKLEGSDILGYHAISPKNIRHDPSLVEQVMNRLLEKPEPSDREFFVGPKPPEGSDVMLEAIIERRKIVEEAKRLNSRPSEIKLQRFTDAIFNNGLSLESIKSYASLDPTPEAVTHMAELLKEGGVNGIPTLEDVEALAAVCRAVLNHIVTDNKGQAPSLIDIKTPFQAWRIRDLINNFILSNKPILVDPGGFDSSRQVKEFYANFNVTEIVLWNHDIWKAAVNGHESFLGTVLTSDIINCAMPMFWQYDLPFASLATGIHGDKKSDVYGLISKGYECIGFVILPTVEAFVKIDFPEGEGVDYTPDKQDPSRGTVTVDVEKPGVREAMLSAKKAALMENSTLRFTKRGISIAIVFLPIAGKAEVNAPEVRFLYPIYEDEPIRTKLGAMILAGLKFLSLKYVAKDTVDVSKKELKEDRALFKKVRKGKVEIPPIKIINLRRAERREKKESTGAKREYSCHFMVDPHWRKQWIPSLNRHEPRRILTYVKGDLTKPFRISRKKVYKAVR